MGFKKPFHRNYRPVKEGPNSGYSDRAYIIDKDYAKNPEHYTRAFLIIQKDVLELFQYIEPADQNHSTYSFRIHELLMRICVEVETNFKAILQENIFTPIYKHGKKNGELRPSNNWNINDFILVNKTHHLDDYAIEMPIWNGKSNIRRPFQQWTNKGILPWYNAYNTSKHDRINSFTDASFEHLIDAFCGLCALLSSQFRLDGFEPGPDHFETIGYNYYGGGFGIGKYLIVDFPSNWIDYELYDFDWTKLENTEERFSKIDYNIL